LTGVWGAGDEAGLADGAEAEEAGDLGACCVEDVRTGAESGEEGAEDKEETEEPV
jgi:hypothetical protein